MIKVEHLVKNYGTTCAVDDISFEIEKGEIVGLLGPNGAGKSTTMNILTGYLSATEGTVEIAGVNVLDDPREAKKHIGFYSSPEAIRRFASELAEFETNEKNTVRLPLNKPLPEALIDAITRFQADQNRAK